VLHCIAVCCSVLQCVAVCCSVLQCVAVCQVESDIWSTRKSRTTPYPSVCVSVQQWCEKLSLDWNVSLMGLADCNGQATIQRSGGGCVAWGQWKGGGRFEYSHEVTSATILWRSITKHQIKIKSSQPHTTMRIFVLFIRSNIISI